MNKNRRKILKYLFSGGLFFNAYSLTKSYPFSNSKISDSYKSIVDSVFLKKIEYHNLHDSLKVTNIPKSKQKNEISKILPQGLKKGSKIAIVAPASHASTWEFRNFLKKMQSLGLKVEIGQTVKKYNVKYRYLSAPDEIRAKELTSYFQRPDIDAIITARGGYGVMRILHLLDFDIICRNPKILIGFSDITALLNAIYVKCNVITYHGPAAISTFDIPTLKNFRNILFSKKNFENIIYKTPNLISLNKGIARAELVGGNLTMITATLGTEFEIQTENKILFFEDVSEEPYQIDRKLTQLFLAGKLTKVKGVLVGKFKNYRKKYYFYPNLSYTVEEVITNRLQELNVPVLLNAPIGHNKEKWILPIGIKAELNADKKYLKILEKTVK